MSEAYVRDARGPYFTQVYHHEIDEAFQKVDKKRRAHAMAVYLVVARHAGRAKSSFPSISRIEDLTGISRPTVVDALKELKRVGLISVERTGKTSIYTLTDHREKLRTLTSEVKDVNSKKIQSKKSVESVNTDSSGKPQTVGLEKYVTDCIYKLMDEHGYDLPNADFAFHLGRAKRMLEKGKPTDEEIEQLPAAFLREWQIKGKADAPSALNELRRQKARPEVLSEGSLSYYQQQASAAAKDKPRKAGWYSAAYGVDEITAQGWIKEGLTHTQILERLGEVA